MRRSVAIVAIREEHVLIDIRMVEIKDLGMGGGRLV